MKIGHISTLALNNSLRIGTLQKQAELNVAQLELSSGKYADIGRELGAYTSQTISLEHQLRIIEQTEITNSLASNRISTMQASVSSMIDVANDFIGQLTSEVTGNVNKEILSAISSSTLSSITSSMNVTYKGEYVFSGLNTDTKALFDYQASDGAAAKAAVENAFQTTFGFAVSDPLAASITPTELENFINGPFAQLFDDGNWSSIWSGASDRGVRSKISSDEIVQNGTTAFDTAFRDITSVAVLATELSKSPLNASTFDKLAELSAEMMGESIALLGAEQSKMGIIEERVSDANEQMDFKKNILNKQLSDLTAVDPYDAALRLNRLSTSLEASYSVTARIQGLSLLNFI